MHWGCEYEGAKRRKYLSDTTRAMRARKARGAKGANPWGTDTYSRVSEILDALSRARVLSASQQATWAKAWDVSLARVEQLVAEARRTDKRLRAQSRAREP